MKKAIGMVEYKTVSSGMRAADLMVKTAEVDILQADTVCPGKFMVLISGELSAVKAAVDAAKNADSEQLIDCFVLGNPHDSIFSALYGASEIGSPNALGVLETFSAAAAIVAVIPPPKPRWSISLNCAWHAVCAANPTCCSPVTLRRCKLRLKLRKSVRARTVCSSTAR